MPREFVISYLVVVLFGSSLQGESTGFRGGAGRDWYTSLKPTCSLVVAAFSSGELWFGAGTAVGAEARRLQSEIDGLASRTW